MGRMEHVGEAEAKGRAQMRPRLRWSLTELHYRQGGRAGETGIEVALAAGPPNPSLRSCPSHFSPPLALSPALAAPGVRPWLLHARVARRWGQRAPLLQ